MYVCSMYVCTYVCIYVCMYVYMYVCMYCNGVAKREVLYLSEATQGNLLGCPRLSPRHSFRTFGARFQCRKLRLLFLLERPLSAGAAAARHRCCQLLHVNARTARNT